MLPLNVLSSPIGSAQWIPTHADILKEKETLDAFSSNASSAARFTGWAKPGAEFKGLGFHGFNVWEANPLCTINKSGTVKHGCSAYDAADGCTMKFMTKEASVYGIGWGKAHHPTVAFHMLRGEAMVWLYAMAALDAIYMMEEDMKSTKASALAEVYSAKLDLLQPPMPPPKKCQAYHCDAKPICYTNYRPHYPSTMRLNDIMVGATNWTGNGPEVDIRPNEAVTMSWWHTNTGYQDIKDNYIGHGASAGEISFLIDIKDKDFIWVFGEYCGGKSMEQAVFYLDENASAAVQPNGFHNGTIYIPTPHRVQWTKLTKMGSEGMHLYDLPKGKHVVSILNNHTAASSKDAQSGLTHIIMWP